MTCPNCKTPMKNREGFDILGVVLAVIFLSLIFFPIMALILKLSWDILMH